MDTRKKGAYLDLEKFLNPDTLRGNLIAASRFLAAYETLRASIMDQIRGFLLLTLFPRC